MIKFAVFKLGTLRRLDLSSRGGTPRLTPPDSPPRLATGVTPKRLSSPLSPRRHSISVATTKNMSDNRSGIFSSIPPTRNNSMASSFDTSEPTVQILFMVFLGSIWNHTNLDLFLPEKNELNLLISNVFSRSVAWVAGPPRAYLQGSSSSSSARAGTWTFFSWWCSGGSWWFEVARG
ncbi:hypothetical protein KSP40_PGU014843 [Platanthera guangdongensis]|uniref:Uncharacterized protein n=1 Tax=Platanthera guangdongensis TaxID=2320717 RepID=A0ABR2M771_9ASPA